MDARTHRLPPPLPPSALADEIGQDGGAVWPRADVGRRIVASLVDSLCLFAALVPGVVLAVAAENDDHALAVAGFVLLGTVVVFAAYQCWLLTTEGQTLAKRWLQLRIVRVEDQGNPGFMRAVVLRAAITGLIGSFLSGLFHVIDLLVMLMREDRRAVHDLLASTEVVDERAPY